MLSPIKSQLGGSDPPSPSLLHHCLWRKPQVLQQTMQRSDNYAVKSCLLTWWWKTFLDKRQKFLSPEETLQLRTDVLYGNLMSKNSPTVWSYSGHCNYWPLNSILLSHVLFFSSAFIDFKSTLFVHFISSRKKVSIQELPRQQLLQHQQPSTNIQQYSKHHTNTKRLFGAEEQLRRMTSFSGGRGV